MCHFVQVGSSSLHFVNSLSISSHCVSISSWPSCALAMGAKMDGQKPGDERSTYDGSVASPGTIVVRIGQRLPDFLQSVKLKYVLRGYNSVTKHALVLLVIPLFMLTAAELHRLGHEKTLQILWDQLQYNLVSVLVCSGAFVFALTLYLVWRPRRVFLVDFACHMPDDKRSLSKQALLNLAALTGRYSHKSIDFQRKILERSGMGDNSFVSEVCHTLPVTPSMRGARQEAQEVIFGALDELFLTTGVKPKDIRILVVNCSLFNPTPSLSAMVVNRYKMRGDIKSISLGGMGCSAGLIAIDLAKDLLQVHRNSYAIVCSQEILSMRPYFGNDRPKLVTNCLFRLGGAAILLSNKMSESWRAKYELMHTVRTHKGADDKCFNCVFEVQCTPSISCLFHVCFGSRRHKLNCHSNKMLVVAPWLCCCSS